MSNSHGIEVELLTITKIKVNDRRNKVYPNDRFGLNYWLLSELSNSILEFHFCLFDQLE